MMNRSSPPTNPRPPPKPFESLSNRGDELTLARSVQTRVKSYFNSAHFEPVIARMTITIVIRCSVPSRHSARCAINRFAAGGASGVGRGVTSSDTPGSGGNVLDGVRLLAYGGVPKTLTRLPHSTSVLFYLSFTLLSPFDVFRHVTESTTATTGPPSPSLPTLQDSSVSCIHPQVRRDSYSIFSFHHSHWGRHRHQNTSAIQAPSRSVSGKVQPPPRYRPPTPLSQLTWTLLHLGRSRWLGATVL